MTELSARLQAAVAALPLRPGLRVIEIGCGPGAAARAVARIVGPGGGGVLAVDRSARAIATLEASLAQDPTVAGWIEPVCCSAAALELSGRPPYDLAFAIRVGALDGRHPAERAASLAAIRAALVPGGPILVGDGGSLVDLSAQPGLS